MRLSDPFSLIEKYEVEISKDGKDRKPVKMNRPTEIITQYIRSSKKGGLKYKDARVVKSTITVRIAIIE